MKYLLIVLFAMIIISCDDNSTDNPPVKKVETELLGKWSGFVKQNNDSVYFMVTFANGEFGPDINGDMYAKIVTGVTKTSTISQKVTIYYTYSKPNIAVRFYTDSDENGFIGTISTDGKTMIGEVQPYDLLFGKLDKYTLTLTK